MSQKALEGIRVLDLSRVLAGPFCTQILGDLGAEVIKVEKPGAGDDTRHWGPPFVKDKDGNDTSESAYYLSANRNKKSLAIDITSKEGQALIHKLLEGTDILIQNFKVGGLDKYGLSYDQLKERYPRLIYCAITGFGQNGPLASEPGYDVMAQAMSGLMACTGDAEGEPMKVGVALSDIMTGLNAAIGILAALNSRQNTGKGQMVDVALLDCSLASLTNIAQYYLTSGKTAPRLGNAHSTIVPYQAFPSADGHIIVAVGNDRQFARFCSVIAREDLPQDTRFSRNTDRVMNRALLVPMIAEAMLKRSTEEWLTLLREADVPCAPVNTMDQVFEMEQIAARDMKITMDHPLSDKPQNLVGSPLKLSGTPVSYDLPPPFLGQHTQEILENTLGLGADEITDLKNKGVIA